VFLEGPVQPGYYQFPYSYTVPQNLPTSFFEKKNENNYAKIEYYTKCVFESQDGSRLEDYDDVYVIQSYPGDLKHQEFAQKFALTSCCRSKGNVEIKTTFNKTIYHPGNTAEFTMWANAGESEVSIKEIRGELTRNVTVKCKGHSKIWSSCVDRITYPSLKKG